MRPCNTGFKEKIKSKILSKLINRSAFFAKLANRHYELLSWIFFILFLGSAIWALRGGYNYYVYGSCNGLNQSGFCAFDPKGKNNEVSEINAQCGTTLKSDKNITLENVDLSGFPAKNIGAEDTIVFIGCYDCDYSRKAYPDIQKLITKKKTNYIFAHYPAKSDSAFLSDIGYCVYKEYGNEFWKFNDYLFEADKNFILNKANTDEILELLNFNADKINECANSADTKNAVQNEIKELEKTNLYGTPTVFINGKPYVGPKPYRVYRSAVNKFIFF